MPKVNYHRGESREFVRRRDPGTWGRKRHRLMWTRRPAQHRTMRGQGGLIKSYRESGEFFIGIRNWCPCCVDATWDRRTRSANSRKWNRRAVHRILRRYDQRLCREGLAEYDEEP